jgi:hypothetical protein
MRSRFLFVLAAFLYANNFFSQNLIVNSILGDDVYTMNQIQKLSITNNRKNLKFQFIDNSEIVYSLDSMNYITFIEQINQISEDKIMECTIFPNPSITELNIRFENEFPNDYVLKIIDQSGQLMEKKNSFEIKNGRVVLNTKLSPGLYFIEIITKDTKIVKSIIFI